MSDLYDRDILEWSERQAELLRRHAAGERINDTDLDWSNIIEEVADVGRNTLRACRSQLLQALLHDLKAEAWPLSREVAHWRSEARVARINAADAFGVVHATEESRRSGSLHQGAARPAGNDGWAAAAPSARGVPGDTG